MRKARISADVFVEFGRDHRAFVFDGGSGRSFTTNSAGGFIVSCLMKGLSRGRIRTLLMREFAVSTRTVERDIDEFLGNLSKLGIIAGSQAERRRGKRLQ